MSLGQISADQARNDRIEEAVSILSFLADAVPAATKDGALPEDSAHGLFLILRAVADSLAQVRNLP